MPSTPIPITQSKQFDALAIPPFTLSPLTPSSTSWLLSDPRFLSWADPRAKSPCNVLYVTGGPCTGKTHLINQLVAHLATDPQQKAHVLRYSFSKLSPGTAVRGKGLGRVVHELVKGLPEGKVYMESEIEAQ